MQEKLRRTAESIAELTQRRDAAHDNLTSPDKTGVMLHGDSARIQRLNNELIELRDRQIEERQSLSWAQDNVKIQESELKKAESRANALEKLREKAYAEYLAEAERIAEAERDEQAIQNWTRRRDARRNEGP